MSSASNILPSLPGFRYTGNDDRPTLNDPNAHRPSPAARLTITGPEIQASGQVRRSRTAKTPISQNRLGNSSESGATNEAHRKSNPAREIASTDMSSNAIKSLSQFATDRFARETSTSTTLDLKHQGQNLKLKRKYQPSQTLNESGTVRSFPRTDRSTITAAAAIKVEDSKIDFRSMIHSHFAKSQKQKYGQDKRPHTTLLELCQQASPEPPFRTLHQTTSSRILTANEAEEVAIEGQNIRQSKKPKISNSKSNNDKNENEDDDLDLSRKSGLIVSTEDKDIGVSSSDLRSMRVSSEDLNRVFGEPSKRESPIKPNSDFTARSAHQNSSISTEKVTPKDIGSTASIHFNPWRAGLGLDLGVGDHDLISEDAMTKTNSDPITNRNAKSLDPSSSTSPPRIDASMSTSTSSSIPPSVSPVNDCKTLWTMITSQQEVIAKQAKQIEGLMLEVRSMRSG